MNLSKSEGDCVDLSGSERERVSLCRWEKNTCRARYLRMCARMYLWKVICSVQHPSEEIEILDLSHKIWILAKEFSLLVPWRTRSYGRIPRNCSSRGAYCIQTTSLRNTYSNTARPRTWNHYLVRTWFFEKFLWRYLRIAKFMWYIDLL